ncbi:MAG: DUF3365 domain-containing protein [Desulfarculus sp.]|nr:DUF3365 domain-containing protein [Desulfarculus sp.]
MDQLQAANSRDQPHPDGARASTLPTWAMAGLIAGLWTVLVLASLTWNFFQMRAELDDLARTQANMAFEKDLIYRRWSASLGGVYARVTPGTPPNPYLQVPERDLTTPGGRELTLVNPAYMTRLVHELGRREMGMQGHITSLKPLRPENAPDPWEAQSLKEFAAGKQVASLRVEMEGHPFLRFMRPLHYEKPCQTCHARQGYELGQVMGGISVAVPLGPLLAATRHHENLMALSHGLLWSLGVVGLVLAFRGLDRRQQARLRAEEKREQTLAELRQALEQVRALKGLLPICASCKRIRDEQGRWQGLEAYISQHSEASFSHGICPQCAQRLYPDLAAPAQGEDQP